MALTYAHRNMPEFGVRLHSHVYEYQDARRVVSERRVKHGYKHTHSLGTLAHEHTRAEEKPEDAAVIQRLIAAEAAL